MNTILTGLLFFLNLQHVLTFTLHLGYKTDCGKMWKTMISFSHINGLLCKQISWKCESVFWLIKKNTITHLCNCFDSHTTERDECFCDPDNEEKLNNDISLHISGLSALCWLPPCARIIVTGKFPNHKETHQEGCERFKFHTDIGPIVTTIHHTLGVLVQVCGSINWNIVFIL